MCAINKPRELKSNRNGRNKIVKGILLLFNQGRGEMSVSNEHGG